MSSRVMSSRAWSVPRWEWPAWQNPGGYQEEYQQELQEDQQDQYQDQQRNQEGQQPTPLQRSTVVLDKRLSCTCSGPSRRRHRQVINNLSGALGQFLSTSFWIPALGLFYLLGIVR